MQTKNNTEFYLFICSPLYTDKCLLIMNNKRNEHVQFSCHMIDNHFLCSIFFCSCGSLIQSTVLSDTGFVQHVKPSTYTLNDDSPVKQL